MRAISSLLERIPKSVKRFSEQDARKTNGWSISNAPDDVRSGYFAKYSPRISTSSATPNTSALRS
jgi:hypothetical protein